MNDEDKEMLSVLQVFSQYDLYSKVDEPFDMEALRPYYEELVREYIPDTIMW